MFKHHEIRLTDEYMSFNRRMRLTMKAVQPSLLQRLINWLYVK